MISNPFIDRRLELRYISEINGWGVYAKELINNDEIIEMSPIIVMPKKLIDVSIWACQAEGIPNKDLMIDQYTLRWKDDLACPLGWIGLYNHSNNNNAIFAGDFDRNMIGILTIKEIVPDTQVTVFYGEHWFTEKGYVKKVEF